jgi:hypothetical protein
VDPSPISFTLLYRFTIARSVYIIAYYYPFTTRYAQSFVHSKPVRLTTSSKLGAKFLVVLFAGSMLLLVKSYTPTSGLSGALVRSVTKLASITFRSLAFSYWFNTLVSQLRETCCCAPHTFLLVFPTGCLNIAPSKHFFGAVAGEKEDFCKGSLARTIFYFVFVLLYFIFTSIILSKIQKN